MLKIMILLFATTAGQDLGAQIYPTPKPYMEYFYSEYFFFNPMQHNNYANTGFELFMPAFKRSPELQTFRIPASMLRSLGDNNSFISSSFYTQRNIKEGMSFYAGPDILDLDPGYQPSINRKEVAPVFNLQVLQKVNDRLGLGLGYQLLRQEEDFFMFNMPSYRYFAGMNADGLQIPWYIPADAGDNIKQQGHFITLLGNYQINKRLSAGLSAGISVYEKDGFLNHQPVEKASSNQYDQYTQFNYQNLEQNYFDWRVSAGLEYQISEETVVGLTFGYLNGNVQQDGLFDQGFGGFREFTQENQNGVIQNTHFKKGASWYIDGGSISGGLQFSHRMNENVRLVLDYTGAHSFIDAEHERFDRDKRYYDAKYVTQTQSGDLVTSETFQDARSYFNQIKNSRSNRWVHTLQFGLDLSISDKTNLLTGWGHNLYSIESVNKQSISRYDYLFMRRVKDDGSEPVDYYYNETSEFLGNVTSDKRFTEIKIPVIFETELIANKLGLTIGFLQVMGESEFNTTSEIIQIDEDSNDYSISSNDSNNKYFWHSALAGVDYTFQNAMKVSLNASRIFNGRYYRGYETSDVQLFFTVSMGF